MKLLNFALLLSCTLLSTHSYAKTKVIPKVIYGQDDRMDVYESSDNLMKELSLSTAAQIYNKNIVENDGVYSIKSESLTDAGMCKSERFAKQMAAANCSGFLVAPDKLVTAGHCINSESECSGHYWVFDFANRDSEKDSFDLNSSQVFRCTKIIERKKESGAGSDYAVLKLERAVTGRTPFKFRKDGKVANDAVLTVIGHPSGLPTKITSAADMRSNSNPAFFVTNADSYGGNSGSAVVDTRTGVVEGILVRGDSDYSHQDSGCLGSVINEQNGGRGEDVTRITIINDLKKIK